ncbi:MAG: glycoside hydrolase family 3 N-terminal domain-containing protein [Clostridiaceae bacterium]|nr:glycoside hydrolase family 3 N-terminal domain-containing protein [Clostridiaceae bacterium]
MKRLILLLLALMLLTSCASVGKVEISLPDDQAESEQTPDAEESPPAQEEEVPQNITTAMSIIEKMTLEDKVGQMFLVRCPSKDQASLASQYALGGYLLFGADFKDKTKEEVTSRIQSYQDASSVPMLIAVDEEGGTVNRISRYKAFRASPFLSPRQLYKDGGFDLIMSDTADKCRLLHALGINVNMAPICDISTDKSSFIYSRSFGQDAALTSRYVLNVMTVMKDEGMGTVLKHFPGYGNCGDSHTEATIDTRSLEEFQSSDFLPFKEGIVQGAGSVLVCHNVVECMDSQNPASLSQAVHKILREDLSFDGVIMTDDLYMDAIKSFTTVPEAAVLAVLAGNDMICCTEFEQQIPAVISAVKEGRISEDQINNSVLRILLWKIDLGIIKQ